MADSLPPPQGTTVLSHGDLSARHILVDDRGHTSGIIDWGDLCLVLPAVDESVPQQQFRQPVPRRHQILSGVLTGTDQIPGSFFLNRRNMNDRDLAQLEQACQMERVPDHGLVVRSTGGTDRTRSARLHMWPSADPATNPPMRGLRPGQTRIFVARPRQSGHRSRNPQWFVRAHPGQQNYDK